jgi:hypothetical protein
MNTQATIGRLLDEREATVVREFERAMNEVTIPEILRMRRLREEAWQKIKNLTLD